jgi:hypothetical protein
MSTFAHAVPPVASAADACAPAEDPWSATGTAMANDPNEALARPFRPLASGHAERPA